MHLIDRLPRQITRMQRRKVERGQGQKRVQAQMSGRVQRQGVERCKDERRAQDHKGERLNRCKVERDYKLDNY